MPINKLLSVGVDAKTIKGQKRGYMTGILYLSPHTSGGFGNLCANASPGCIDSCLYTAGRGVMAPVRAGRMRKTKLFRTDRPGFMAQLIRDILALKHKAKRERFKPLVRLNGTSDIPWEHVRANRNGSIMDTFTETQFYDYTKSAHRMRDFLQGFIWTSNRYQPWPKNYHLTFSRSECNEADCLRILKAGGNVAVVFDTPKGCKLPLSWKGHAVVDGDVNDARPGDVAHGSNGAVSMVGGGLVIGLRAKGRARRDTSGFVVKV